MLCFLGVIVSLLLIVEDILVGEMTAYYSFDNLGNLSLVKGNDGGSWEYDLALRLNLLEITGVKFFFYII